MWIQHFLCDRYQRVIAGGRLSSWSTVQSGVPQGSVLPPLLFCLFVDNLQAVCKNSLMFKYADDVNILHFIRHGSEDELQTEWDNVSNWSTEVRLPINMLKCNILDVVTKRSLTPVPVFADDFPIPQVLSLKLLGVTFTHDLKWDSHYKLALTKASKRIFLIRNLRRSDCPTHLLLQAYKVFVRSIILYAFPTICNAPSFLKNKLLRFERRILRIVGCDTNTFPSIIESGEELCQRLFAKVSVNPSHPLRQCFASRPDTSRRLRKTSLDIRPVRAKTKRLHNSFVRFCR